MKTDTCIQFKVQNVENTKGPFSFSSKTCLKIRILVLWATANDPVTQMRLGTRHYNRECISNWRLARHQLSVVGQIRRY